VVVVCDWGRGGGGGGGGAFFILVLCFILYNIKVKNKITLSFYVIITFINTRFSVVKNATRLLSLQSTKNTMRIM